MTINNSRISIGISSKLKLLLMDLIYKANSKVLYSFLNKILAKPVNGVVLNINNICNYKCLYCRRDKHKGGLDNKYWLNLIAEISKAGIRSITLVGGDILLYPQLYEVLERVGSEGFTSVYIVTNGSLLTNSNIRSLKRYSPVLVVKYGTPSYLYNKITGQSAYALRDIEANIKRCVDAGLKVITFSVLKDFNTDRVREIIDSSLRLGAFPTFERYFTFENYLNLSGSDKEKTFFITSGDFKDALFSLEEYFGRYKKAFLASLRIKGKNVCGGFSDILYINRYGDVYPCIYFPEEHFYLGNITREKFISIYERWEDKRKSPHYEAYKINKDCKGCFFYYLCQGGCAALRRIGAEDYYPCLDRDTCLRKIGYFLAAI